MNYENKKQKVIAISSFVSIIIGNLVGYFHPAKGYELCMYEATPFLVWLFFFIAILGGVIILIFQVKSRLYYKSNFWLIGFIILLICRYSILYIPYTRGYYTFYYDHIDHIGMIKDIVSAGEIHITNFYPITHIFLAEIVLISRLPVLLISNHSTAIFSSLFIVSIYLLSKYSMNKDVAILSVASIGGVIFNGYDFYLMPNGWSMLYMPLAIFVYLKSLRTFEYKILLVLMLLLYPFFHPFSTMMLVFYLSVIGTVKTFISIRNNKYKLNVNTFINISVTPILILVVTSLIWMLNFRAFWPIIRNLYFAAITGKSSSVIGGMSDTLQKINLSGIDFLELVIRSEGDILIYLMITVLSFYIYFKNTKKYNMSTSFLVIFSMIFATSFFYASYLFNIIPGLQNINAGRILAFMSLFVGIPVAYFFKYMIEQRKSTMTFLCIIIILITSIISVFGVLPSPLVIRPSLQVSQMDVDSSAWIINYKNTSIESVYIQTSPLYKIADLTIGYAEKMNRTDLGNVYSQIPDHFNYSHYSGFGYSYNEDKYSLIHKMDEMAYSTVWEAVGRFNENDFKIIEHDKTVDKLYSNNECSVFYIHSVAL
jgi:hypothetical protein